MVPYELMCYPGTGTLHLGAGLLAKTDWRRSALQSWSVAKRITQHQDMDALLEVQTPNVLTGTSAGLSIGLAAMAELSGAAMAPFFATGEVLPPHGYLSGGQAAQVKGRFLCQNAQLTSDAMHFVTPPLAEAACFNHVDLLQATDLTGAALLLLRDPGRLMAEVAHPRHGSLHDLPGGMDGRFVITHGASDPHEKETPQGIRIVGVVAKQAPCSLFGESGQVYWASPGDASLLTTEQLSRLWDAAANAWKTTWGRFLQST